MNIKNIAESNREAWNEAVTYHQQARNNALQTGFASPGFTTFDRDCDDVLISHLEKMNISGKTIAQLPCNNGRELLSLMRFGAREATGFDISDVAIAEARQLAEISGLNARFERINILEIDDSYNSRFDFIYISEGSLQWFPDLHAYFSVVSRLLKENGEMLIFEMHPFAYFFENGYSPEIQSFRNMISYFDKGAYNYETGLDYVGGVQYESKTCYWFMHKMSDIINAVLQNGIGIREFNEYNLEMANNESAAHLTKFPLSYILIGKKNDKN